MPRLCERCIDSRLCCHAERSLLDIAHHSDYFQPDRLILTVIENADSFSDRVFSLEVIPDEPFRDNSHFVCRGCVSIIELPSLNQWDTHCTEVVRADERFERDSLRQRRPPFNTKITPQ